MLERVGVPDVDALFADLPAAMRDPAIDLPPRSRRDASAGRPPAALLVATAGAEPERARALLHGTLLTKLRYRLRHLPARLLHDEVQPEGQ